jgi:hypothetical protein
LRSTAAAAAAAGWARYDDAKVRDTLTGDGSSVCTPCGAGILSEETGEGSAVLYCFSVAIAVYMLLFGCRFCGASTLSEETGEGGVVLLCDYCICVAAAVWLLLLWAGIVHSEETGELAALLQSCGLCRTKLEVLLLLLLLVWRGGRRGCSIAGLFMHMHMPT